MRRRLSLPNALYICPGFRPHRRSLMVLLCGYLEFYSVDEVWGFPIIYPWIHYHCCSENYSSAEFGDFLVYFPMAGLSLGHFEVYSVDEVRSSSIKYLWIHYYGYPENYSGSEVGELPVYFPMVGLVSEEGLCGWCQDLLYFWYWPWGGWVHP